MNFKAKIVEISRRIEQMAVMDAHPESPESRRALAWDAASLRRIADEVEKEEKAGDLLAAQLLLRSNERTMARLRQVIRRKHEEMERALKHAEEWKREARSRRSELDQVRGILMGYAAKYFPNRIFDSIAGAASTLMKRFDEPHSGAREWQEGQGWIRPGEAILEKMMLVCSFQSAACRPLGGRQEVTGVDHANNLGWRKMRDAVLGDRILCRAHAASRLSAVKLGIEDFIGQQKRWTQPPFDGVIRFGSGEVFNVRDVRLNFTPPWSVGFDPARGSANAKEGGSASPKVENSPARTCACEVEAIRKYGVARRKGEEPVCGKCCQILDPKKAALLRKIIFRVR